MARPRQNPSSPAKLAYRYAGPDFSALESRRFDDGFEAKMYSDEIRDENATPRQVSRFPKVKKVDDDAETTLTPRRVLASFEAFGLMVKHGAGFGDALKAALSGRCMTPDQAATCIQTFWRRYQTLVLSLTKVVAAQIIQRAARHRRWRKFLAAERLQAASLAMAERRQVAVFREAKEQFVAARKLQSKWRQRQARLVLVRALAAKRNSKLKRSFSWSRKNRAAPRPSSTSAVKRSVCLNLSTGGHLGITLSDVPGGAGVRVDALDSADLCARAGLKEGDLLVMVVDLETGEHTAASHHAATIGVMESCTGRVQLDYIPNGAPNGSSAPTDRSGAATRVIRRALSFESKGRRDGGRTAPASAPTSEPPLPHHLPLWETLTLNAGHKGLGLELDQTNSVQRIVPGGAAEAQGVVRLKDVIVVIDGVPLRGRLLHEVIERGKSQYTVQVRRLPVRAASPVSDSSDETPRKVRRSASFSRGVSSVASTMFKGGRERPPARSERTTSKAARCDHAASSAGFDWATVHSSTKRPSIG